MESMIIIENNKNFKKQFMALSVLDRIVSDGAFQTEIDKETINHMLQLVKSSKAMRLDEYLTDVIQSYVRRKHKITINLSGLEGIQDAIAGLVIESDLESVDINDEWDPNNLLSRRNLLSTEIFTILPNVSEIIIKTNFDARESPYPFNIVYLLECMNEIATWQRIKIEHVVRGVENENKSWLCRLWNSEAKKLLMDECAKFKLNINFHKTIDDRNFYLSFESLAIERQIA